jgi:hypothetical protein
MQPLLTPVRFLPIGLLLLGAVPTPTPKLPEELSRVPAKVRDEATVVVTGTFGTGRGPCEFLPDGSRRWALLRGFRITGRYRGDVGTDYIGIDDAVFTKQNETDEPLESESDYLLLLKPSEKSLAVLRTGEGSLYYGNALEPIEVLAIVKADKIAPP